MKKIELKAVDYYLTKLTNSEFLIDRIKFKEDGINLTTEELELLSKLDYEDLVGKLPFMIDGKIECVNVHPFVEVIGEVIVDFLIKEEFLKALINIGLTASLTEKIEKHFVLFQKLGGDIKSFLSAVKKNRKEKGSWL